MPQHYCTCVCTSLDRPPTDPRPIGTVRASGDSGGPVHGYKALSNCQLVPLTSQLRTENVTGSYSYAISGAS